MPTFEAEVRFLNQYRQLSAAQRAQFRRALQEFVRVLREWDGRAGVPEFPAHLGIKPFQGRRRIMEFAWAPDGRCTWEYGAPRGPGKRHIVWRRIGSHEIYADP